MIKHNKSSFIKNNTKKLFLSSILVSSLFSTTLISQKASFASPFEFQWDPDPNWVKLKFFQSSDEKLDRATYYFFLRPRNRKTGILKLTIKVPKYFEAEIKPNRISLCQVLVGNYSEKTKCLKQIPAVVEVNSDQTAIDIFPEQPIPKNKKSYSVVMKIYNPRKAGMFQFHAYAQSPGAVPISGYVGTWNFSVQ